MAFDFKRASCKSVSKDAQRLLRLRGHKVAQCLDGPLPVGTKGATEIDARQLLIVDEQ